MSFKIICISDAQMLISTPQTQVIDIRDHAAFSVGHINGAQHVGEHNIDGFIAAADMDKPLIICCYSGMMSQNAAAYFCEQGFDEVYSLEGGYSAWQAQE